LEGFVGGQVNLLHRHTGRQRRFNQLIISPIGTFDDSLLQRQQHPLAICTTSCGDWPHINIFPSNV
jgi:hypothetical protein